MSSTSALVRFVLFTISSCLFAISCLIPRVKPPDSLPLPFFFRFAQKSIFRFAQKNTSVFRDISEVLFVSTNSNISGFF